MKLKAFLALIGASIANDDILEEGLIDQNSPQFNNLSEEVQAVDSLGQTMTNAEQAREQEFKEQLEQQKSIEEAFEQPTSVKVDTQHTLPKKEVKAHVQTKNFPAELKQHDMPKLNSTTPKTDLTISLKDIRLPTGYMNFTADQQETIKAFLKQKKWADNQNDWFSKRDGIQHMDKSRRKEENEQRDKLGAITKRKDSSKHLNIHIIPHTHDDVGWIKTYEEYYTGYKEQSAHARVSQIITEVVIELLRDTDMKFTYVEMKFFNMWYTRQTKKMQEDVKNLIKTGRLEITMGGWVGSEESVANYEDIISNFVKGHGWIKEEFGDAPTIGWNIDPFGHTQANAAIYHDLGFEALFFARAGNDEIKQRFDPENHASLFLWRPLSKHFGNQKEILGGIITEREDYQHPMGYRMDERTDMDPPVQDDPTLSDYNVFVKMTLLFNQAHDQINGQSNDANIMFAFGDDFAFMNAFANFDNIRKTIKLCNEHGAAFNITCTMSTPKQYVNALKEEKATYPIKYDDFMNYYQEEKDKSNRTQYNFWSGYYSSRPGIKAHVKTASAQYHAQSKIVARKMLEQGVKEADIKEYLKSNDILLDQLAILQHHDAITGTATQYVTLDYQYRLQKAQDISDVTYKKEVIAALQAYAGISVKDGSKAVKRCVGQQNATVTDCPVNYNSNKDFIVAVHNPRNKEHNGLIRIQLPNNNYKAQLYSIKAGVFQDVQSDILEQKHWKKDGSLISDYEMVIQTAEIFPDQVALVKVIYTPNKTQEKKEVDADPKQGLEITGFSDDGHALFEYTNAEQGLKQTFGVNLKKYIAHSQEDVPVNKMFQEQYMMTVEEKADNEPSEGAYIFKPEWRSPKPQIYSKLSEDVIYEKGQNIEQWTIIFDDPKAGEKAIIKVRFSPFIAELIEFVVELNPIPNEDAKGKDVTVNFKMFNGFDAKKTFWTDSNSLEMEQRNIRELIREDETLAGNIYPITSAIAMRDFRQGSNTQVTIMNDRVQGGSADLSDNSTIEMIQHRRILKDDGKGVSEPLNETDTFDDLGLQITARYYMQIFDQEKGKSLQRTHQIRLQDPLQYFFIFDFKEGNEDAKRLTQTHQSLATIKQNKFLDQGSYKLIPVAKDQVIMRVENLADRFDKSTEVSMINVDKLANELYFEINQKQPDSLTIEEVTIQGTMSEKDRLKNTFKWTGVDDGSQLEFSKRPEDQDGFKGVAMEPQRIRSFKLTYNQRDAKAFTQSKVVKLNAVAQAQLE